MANKKVMSDGKIIIPNSIMKIAIKHRDEYKKGQAHPRVGRLLSSILSTARFQGGFVNKLRAKKVYKFIEKLEFVKIRIDNKMYTLMGTVVWGKSIINGNAPIPRLSAIDEDGSPAEIAFYVVMPDKLK